MLERLCQRWAGRRRGAHFNAFCVFTVLALLLFSGGNAAEDLACRAVEQRDCSRYGNAKYDVLIYGSTPGGIAAAIQTKRMGKSVAIVCAGARIGGMTTSGLGWTDSKHGSAIGGIAREFYQRIYNAYMDDSRWKKETRAQYINKKIGAQPGPAIDERNKVQWTFEPHVAEEVFEAWVKELNIPIFRSDAIDRSQGSIVKKDNQITSFKTLSGKVYDASMFIDASYEGDLMAAAGIPYSMGSESATAFGESLGGIQIAAKSAYLGLDPYVKKGDPSSGLLYGIERTVPASHNKNGSSDLYRLQPFNYRVSLTEHDDNKIPFFKPEGYKETTHELLLRFIEAGHLHTFFTLQKMPNGKTDSNAAGEVSTDLMGGNYNWAKRTSYIEASYAERAEIVKTHKVYTQGFFWTLVNHPRVPKETRDSVGRFGYVNDEWNGNDNWPYEVYIREGRRMRAAYTMTQNDVQQPKNLDDAIIGLGSYTLDVHQMERIVIDGEVYDEGLVHTPVAKPFPIPFGSLVPPTNGVNNFLNPVTMGSTHVAFASIRMEPTYMIMGQSAAVAAVQALEQCVKIQDVDRAKLSSRLKEDKQVLSW